MKISSQLKRVDKPTIVKHLIAVVVFGTCYGLIEYVIKVKSDPQVLWPLLLRVNIGSLLIYASIAITELLVFKRMRQKRFIYVVFKRSALYTLIVVFWLVIINLFWGKINYGDDYSSAVLRYFDNPWWIVNLMTIFVALSIMFGLYQINKLHRKGELAEFITGKYHRPREVERIFCFIDLKSSTMIAEQLGHYEFSLFLQDYFSDITDAILSSRAEVYQYVGDEIVLTWPLDQGLEDNRALLCYFTMKQDIERHKSKYTKRYGCYPQFRAGIHGGKATVTWVGEVKKEIVFVGDVLNTASRIQEACKRLKQDYLISEELLSRFSNIDGIDKSFEEEMIPRGKQQSIRIYSLETQGAV